MEVAAGAAAAGAGVGAGVAWAGLPRLEELLEEPDRPPGWVLGERELMGSAGRFPKKGGCIDIWALSKN